MKNNMLCKIFRNKMLRTMFTSAAKKGLYSQMFFSQRDISEMNSIFSRMFHSEVKQIHSLDMEPNRNMYI